MDPVSDMLSSFSNCIQKKKLYGWGRKSKLTIEICKVLLKNRVIRNFFLRDDIIIVEFIYSDSLEPFVTQWKKLSKPGKRVYFNLKEIKNRSQFGGLMIISTSQGLKTGAECLKNNIGGEALIWVNTNVC